MRTAAGAEREAGGAMARAMGAGAAYFGTVFLVGFGLGSARVVLLEPRVGALAATALETPVILGASWVICRALVARLRVAPEMTDRLAMGATAFVLLMLAETALSVLAFGRTFAEHLAALTSTAGLLGLAGQIVYAFLPLLERSTQRRT